jgi:hypothetical protein
MGRASSREMLRSIVSHPDQDHGGVWKEGAVSITPDQVEQIQTREDFARFLKALAHEAESHGDEWENPDLPRFLEAAAAWTGAMPGYFRNIGEPLPEHPSWKLFAQILVAATLYE